MEGRGVLKSGGLSKGQLSCRQQSLLVTTNKIYGSLNARMRHKGPSHVLDRDAFCKVLIRLFYQSGHLNLQEKTRATSQELRWFLRGLVISGHEVSW